MISQIVWKCLYLARSGRPDISWSVNKLVRAVTKWTQECDRRSTRLTSYIHQTQDYRQYCHVGNTAQHCPLDLLQDSDFAGDLGRLEINIRWNFYVFGSRIFVPVHWMCKKQTAISHSSTESEIIPLDAGLWMDGLPASDPWDIVVSGSPQINKKPSIIASGNGSEISKVHQSN